MLKDKTKIIEEPLDQALSERYLSYALSTITQRALPDVRDGLKPVHRRILYAMLQLKLDPKSGYKKCARVVGETIGRFHPHGEQSIYDALVRLAQEFAHRYPLIDGQGNFGNIDGDSAAAMRYTEARLTEFAKELLRDIDQDTVDFRETYDGEDSEPIIFPAAFPNLLANGTNGIAVGMATNIPPHNISEICDAACYLIDHPNADTQAILQFVKGPDFPTAGILCHEADRFHEAYKTGRGRFLLRARWEIEKGDRNSWQIIITEIPYQVQKAKLIEKIAELMEQKKLPLLANISDESAEDVRLVLEPKSRNLDPEILMELLFKLTDLETRISLNMNVLDKNRTPGVMGIVQVLKAFLDHRRDVLQRKTKHRIDKIEHRLEILEGYLSVYLNLDEVIALIREAEKPKQALIERFDLTEIQVEAILNMRLRALHKLEEIELQKEKKQLDQELSDLKNILMSEKKQWKTIQKEIERTKKQICTENPFTKRQTSIQPFSSQSISNLDDLMIAKEAATVVLSEKGWIRSLKGHVIEIKKIRFKEEDSAYFIIQAETTDKILMITTDGKIYTLPVDKLPGGRGYGEPIRVIVDMEDHAEPIGLFKYEKNGILLFVSSSGNGFMVRQEDLIASKKIGKQVMKLAENETMILARPIKGDLIACVSSIRKLLIFSKGELPILSRGKGVKLQKLTKEASLQDVIGFSSEEGLSYIDTANRRVLVKNWKNYMGKRAQTGMKLEKGVFPKSGYFIPKKK